MTAASLDIHAIREQFPILSRTVHGGKPLVYLDTAATSQKPRVVIDAIDGYYAMHNSNVHRGAHTISAEATTMWERTRQTVQQFLNATREDEVIFTRGTTESINLVASSWGDQNVAAGDEILITGMEHHANIVPWQMLCQRKGATLKHIPVLPDGSLDMEAVPGLLTDRVKMFSMTHVSNTLGTVNDVHALCAMARERGITTMVDGAQSVLHLKIDVQEIGCDFFAFSAHKLYGPTGIGCLWGRYEILDAMPPYQGGGAMIKHVTYAGTEYEQVPIRFEAGTPHIAGAAGLEAAINWFGLLDLEALDEHERALVERATAGLQQIDGMRIIGTTPHKVGIVSFVISGLHGTDIGMLLDEQGIAIRTGHHCTMPLLESFGVGSTCRASFGVYTTMDEIDEFLVAVNKAVRMLR